MATRLRRLKIEHFRDVRPGTELRFGDGWNVLVGRICSGKQMRSVYVAPLIMLARLHFG